MKPVACRKRRLPQPIPPRHLSSQTPRRRSATDRFGEQPTRSTPRRATCAAIVPNAASPPSWSLSDTAEIDTTPKEAPDLVRTADQEGLVAADVQVVADGQSGAWIAETVFSRCVRDALPGMADMLSAASPILRHPGPRARAGREHRDPVRDLRNRGDLRSKCCGHGPAIRSATKGGGNRPHGHRRD